MEAERGRLYHTILGFLLCTRRKSVFNQWPSRRVRHSPVQPKTSQVIVLVPSARASYNYLSI